MAHNNLVQSVLRALDIMLEVGSAQKKMTLRELSLRLDLKIPTLHNLLRTLKARGFVRQCPGQPLYVLGPAIFDLIALHYESSLMAEAEITVRSLFNEMRQKVTVTFSEQIGGSLQTSLRMSPDQPSVMQKPRRQILNSYTSATALVLHVFGSEEDRHSVQERHPFQECAGMFADNPEKFTELVKQIRRRGYVVRPGFNPGQIAMAVPVLNADDELLGIMGLSRINPSGPAEKKSVKQIMLNPLLKAARNISKKIYHQPEINAKKHKKIIWRH